MKQAGQIVLFPFPHTDLGEGKLRPALLLGRLPGEYDDWLIWWRSDSATVSASLTAFFSPATLRLRPSTSLRIWLRTGISWKVARNTVRQLFP